MTLARKAGILALAAAAAMAGAVGLAGAQDKKVVKVAYVGPLTGPNTAMGIGTRNSIELAIREANATNTLPFRIEPLPLRCGAGRFGGRFLLLRALIRQEPLLLGLLPLQVGLLALPLGL